MENPFLIPNPSGARDGGGRPKNTRSIFTPNPSAKEVKKSIALLEDEAGSRCSSAMVLTNDPGDHPRLPAVPVLVPVPTFCHVEIYLPSPLAHERGHRAASDDDFDLDGGGPW